MLTYFFDSYALIEIVKGSENYKRFQDSRIITTKLNLLEVHYILLRDVSKEIADRFLLEYYVALIDFNKQDIIQSNEFKLKYKDRNLSMTDCLGYILSKKLEIKFLTGDKEFKDLLNVEFMK
ncbi:MAG: PIN domain-containing protein [Nanoarchaeota archaeon]|nr:PIN domain-containing protein [Nanoarchaeota archaeon]